MHEQWRGVCTEIKRKNYGVSSEYVLRTGLRRMLESGLQVVTLCNDGSGRSWVVAETLTDKFGIPAVSINKGLCWLKGDRELSISFPYFVKIINTVPFVCVILTHQEICDYFNQINQLKKSIYKSSTSAIESICRMIN